MEDCTEQVKKEIEGINGIELTTDAWTSLATESYIIYTAPYITKEWEMKSRVLSTHSTEDRHTAYNLAADMKANEQKWGIHKLLFDSIHVHDNATNVTKAPKIMDKLGIGCLAHTINLAAFFATSIEQVTKILNRARSIIKTFKKSTLAANVLKNKQTLLLPTK